MAAQPQCEPSLAGASSCLSDRAKLSVLRKKLARRVSPDRSQIFRCSFQLAFLLLNVWLSAAFYSWVRQIETGPHDRTAIRPPGIEGWLPIAGLMKRFQSGLEELVWVQLGHWYCRPVMCISRVAGKGWK